MKHTIATTVNDPMGFDYQDYLDYCEANCRKPAAEDSDEFYDWISEETAYNFENDMYNIKEFKPYQQPVVITGTLGLWDGKHDICPVEKESVYDAIYACADGCAEIEVEWEDGIITVYGYHHDGTNIFKIGKNLPYLYGKV